MRKFFLTGLLLGFCLGGFVQSLWSMCEGNFHSPTYTISESYCVSEVEEILMSDCEGVNYKGFIRGISDLLGVDPVVCLAIAEVENPNLDPLCVHINENGTADLGLFQLNSNYIEYFKDRYWDFSFNFNPMNGCHNAYVAMRLISRLYSLLGDWDGVVMAYNCGYTCIVNGSVPKSTEVYFGRVKTVIQRISED